MLLKTISFSVGIFFFRIIDLYTTKLACIDFKKQEQSMLVKSFNLNMTEFIIAEIIFAFILIIIYLFSFNKTNIYLIKTNSFSEYVFSFFFNDPKGKLPNIFAFSSLKKLFYLYGSIIPQLYIMNSIILSLNNYWVYLYSVKKNITAINSYNYLNNYYFFDFIILYFPIILFLFFSYRKLKFEYYKNSSFHA